MLDFSFYGKTTKMARIRPGFLLLEILMRFYRKAGGNLSPDQSLYLYSAHDVTVFHLIFFIIFYYSTYYVLHYFKLKFLIYFLIANILGGLGVYNEVSFISTDA